jgi:hypothetical protein
MKSNNQLTPTENFEVPLGLCDQETLELRETWTPTFGKVSFYQFTARNLQELKSIKKLYSLLQKELQPRNYVKDPARIRGIANTTRSKKGHIEQPILLAYNANGRILSLVQGHGRDGSFTYYVGFDDGPIPGTIPFGSVNFGILNGYYSDQQLQILSSELQPPDDSPESLKKEEIVNTMAFRLSNGFDHDDLGIPRGPYNKMEKKDKTKLKSRLRSVVQFMKPKWSPSTIDGVVEQALMTNSNTDKKFVGISQEEANKNQLPLNIEPYQAVPNEPENEIHIYKAMKISDRTKTIGSLSEHMNGTLTSHPVDVIVNDKGEKEFHVSENVKKQSISENYSWVNDETVYNIDLSVYLKLKSIKEIDVMQEDAEKKMLQLKSDVESWLGMISGNYKVRVTISREKNPQFGYTLDEDDARNEFGTNCQVKNRKFTVQNF